MTNPSVASTGGPLLVLCGFVFAAVDGSTFVSCSMTNPSAVGGPLVLLLSGLLFTPVGASLVSCTDSADCEAALRPGSLCRDGLCTNPFHHGGCLGYYLDEDDARWRKQARVCGSEDSEEAQLRGDCRPSPFQYKEIRIQSYNWESANYINWIYQILMSEILGVPTSIETGSPDTSMDFYHPHAPFDFQKSVTARDWDELKLPAAEPDGDCKEYHSGAGNYTPCAHLRPEVWLYQPYWRDFLTVRAHGGFFGENSMFVSKNAVLEDPSLTSYLGLMGENNRRKLAQTFKRPTRWKDYCELISPSNCSEAGPVAKRPPNNEEENTKFYEEEVYSGYFRDTEKNNCDLNPNCTGHFTDYPCWWSTYAQQFAYHLDIALSFEGSQRNNGYSYDEITQIIYASNSTKSPILFMFWSPHPLFESFVGTDMEFTKVNFPWPTQSCVDSRVGITFAMCEEDKTFEEKMGPPEMVCDQFPTPIYQVISTGLLDLSKNPSIPETFWSPAHDTVAAFSLNNLYMEEIFNKWSLRGGEPDGFDTREAVCEWVAENLDFLLRFVPLSYPRVLEETDSREETVFPVAFYVAVVTGAFALSLAVATLTQRKMTAFHHAQVEVLLTVEAGGVFQAVASALMVVAPTDFVCGSYRWFGAAGYVLQKIPMLLRLFAIYKLVSTGKQMQRARLGLRNFLSHVFMALLLAMGYMAVWTSVDRPTEMEHSSLSDQVTSKGETVVFSRSYCGQENLSLFLLISALCGGIVVVLGCVLAVLTLRVKEDMNDTKDLSLAFFLHSIFFILLACLYFLLEETESPTLVAYGSLVVCADTIFSTSAYVIPKFWDRGEKFDTEPLPDVFVHTTVAIIDIIGFADWSSQKEPVNVFQFLDQLYEQYAMIASRYGVYTAETSGGRYVAVTGVPKFAPNHAVMMAKFVFEVMTSMPGYTRQKLAAKFGIGPDELSFRAGIHSGPVSGGFLIAGKRFQVFGATATVTELLTFHSWKRCIHVSEATHSHLCKAGKSGWLVPREETVAEPLDGIEGPTYWLVNGSDASGDGQSDVSPAVANPMECSTSLGSSDPKVGKGDTTLPSCEESS